MSELLELFAAWRADIDSEPFNQPAADTEAAVAAGWDQERATCHF